jgi:hypothetical protein
MYGLYICPMVYVDFVDPKYTFAPEEDPVPHIKAVFGSVTVLAVIELVAVPFPT